jgi:periplasmic divalent cation tolerance protein
MFDALIILSTCPDTPTAEGLARALVKARLAACVNVLPGIRSIYRWQEVVEEEAEVLLLIKTRAEAFEMLESWLIEHHPYEVPEIVALPASRVAAPYLEWLENSVQGGTGA